MVDLGPHPINFAENFNVVNVGMSRYLYRKLELASESISSERDKHFKLGKRIGVTVVWLITSAELFVIFREHCVRWRDVHRI